MTIYRYGFAQRIAREQQLADHARWQTARMHSAISMLDELVHDPSMDDPGYIDALTDATRRLIEELETR